MGWWAPLTAVENLLVTMLAGRQPANRESTQRAEQQLAALGLAPATWHNLVEQLSGGQQQRWRWAGPWCCGRPLLVLDHPTSELDPDSVELVDQVLAAIQQQGSAVLLAADEEILLDHCDQIVELGRGRRPGQAGRPSTSRKNPRADRNADSDSR